MAIAEALLQLNLRGAISSALLVRRCNLTFEEARKILKDIVDGSTNVAARNEDQIYIVTRIPEAWKPKPKVKKRIKYRYSYRWKDVTKP